MAPRPNWKGYLKLSLVSCPIALYPAASASERVSFRQINKKTGHRLKQQLVDSVTGEPVDSEDKGRGYEVGKDQYLPVADEELEALQVESTRTIEIDTFVPREQIDLSFVESPYYIVPTDKVGQEAFAVIREAMRGKEMVALGRVVMARRERPIVLEPLGKGLRGLTLRYPYEVRDASAYFDEIADVKVPGEMLKLAEHILESKTADFDPSTFEDRYETAVVEMLKAKQAGMPVRTEAAAPAPSTIINLMDALKRSIATERKPAVPSPRERLAPTFARKGRERGTARAVAAKTAARPGRAAPRR
jgi:DNA end-binding protein Ku